MKREVFAVADIYVPVRRRATLEQKRVNEIAASMKLAGREALMALYSGYGQRMTLSGADALEVNISRTPGVVIIEYEVQGTAVRSGKVYENRFISVVAVKDRKIVGWRDYMDSLAAMSALT